jgi:HSP20 family protein
VKNLAQNIPVRIHRSDNKLVLAAPLPGLSPDEITVTIQKNAVLLHGEKHGSSAADLDFIANEWSIGPYMREITLPEPIKGDVANATYGNGVLVLSLPIAKDADESVQASFQLRPVSATHGERVGHVGHAIQPATTEEHLKKHRG